MVEFFGALVMWELGLIFIAMVVWGFSLWNETSLGFLAVLVILMSISWTGVGSGWAVISFTDMVWQIVVYLGMGILWSVWKWKTEAVKVRDSCLLYNKSNDNYYSRDDIIIKINDNKNYDTIGFWIIVWPLSAVGYFINDFIIDTIKSIIKRMYNVYDRITNYVMKDI